MKKLLIFLAIMLSIGLIYYLRQTNKFGVGPKLTKQLVSNTTSKNKNLIDKVEKKDLKVIKVGKLKEIDINKMHPCEALSALTKHKKPWLFLDSSNPHKTYIDVQDSLDSDLKSKDMTPMQREKLYTQLDSFTISDYLPYLENVYLKAKKSNNNTMLKEKLESRLLYEFEYENSIELGLSRAKYLYQKGNIAESIQLLEKVTEDKYLKNSNGLEKHYLELFNKASTPSEISAAIETGSRAPTFDFSYLLDIKKESTSKAINKILDKIALRLINRTLSTKLPFAVDYLSYDIAIRLHSKGELIEKKYGTRDEVVQEFLSKTNIDNSQSCDDREIINLCTKYCRK